METKYYKLIKRLFDKQKTFYTMFGASITPAEIKALSGDYVIIAVKHGDQNINVHCHYTQVEVIGDAG